MMLARWILAPLLLLAACTGGDSVPDTGSDIGGDGNGSGTGDDGNGNDAPVPTGNEPGLVVRGPQIAQAQPDSIVIAWRSDLDVVGAVVLDTGERLVDSAPTDEHVFTFTGLSPDTAYEYSVEQEGVVLSSGHPFKTAPPVGTGTVRFVVVGDSGTGGSRQREVAVQMAASQPDLVLITGDAVYNDGDYDELDPNYFEPYASMIDRIPFYIALGNHDDNTDNGRPLLDSLYLPSSTEGGERYYSFDRGPVHYVALDSNQDLDAGSDQYDWLAADLAANTNEWTILYLHHPPYSSSAHGSDEDVRDAIVPLCDQYGVDIVFAGHDHVYERTHRMVDSVVDPDGTLYIVTGGGGRGLYDAGDSYFTAETVKEYHHCEVVVENGTLTLRAIDKDGVEIDSTTIQKP
ncbi:MAG: purple acid phosphatase family protein [Planctomycetota bacterium]|jgi:3',5'-cyclic AMP phosphodiesterase CpdA